MISGSFSPATSDLVDLHEASVQSCALPFRDYGGATRFHGRIRTLRCYEDNALLKSIVSQPGEGAVLVVDGGGSTRAALVGDKIAGLALDHGWAGLILWGAVRDTAALAGLRIGIKALGSNPWKSGKAGAGIADTPVSFGGATFGPGAWVYADEDGIVVSADRLHPCD